MKLKKKEVEHFKKLLSEEETRLMSTMGEHYRSELIVSKDDLSDETDQAVSEISQGMLFRLRDRERKLLSKVRQAITRLNEGQFGICTECEEDIEKNRLMARPVTTLCLSCKEAQEKQEKVFA